MKLIIRNIKNGDLYKHLFDERFVNIRTGESGILSPQMTENKFSINVEAMELINLNPNIELLINKLNLKIILPSKQ